MGPFIITTVLGHFIGPWIIKVLHVFKNLDNIGLKVIVGIGSLIKRKHAYEQT